MGRAFEFRKARKMKRWSAMSKTFTRLGKDISIAVKEGGSDPETNSLVGDDGADSHYGCNKEYVCSICHSCNKKNPGACQNLPWWLGGTECEKTSKKASRVSCKCCPRQLLDYILVSKKSHLLKSNSRVILLKSPKKFKVGFWRLKENMMVNPDFCTTDLSDHYPLLGEFVFLI